MNVSQVRSNKKSLVWRSTNLQSFNLAMRPTTKNLGSSAHFSENHLESLFQHIGNLKLNQDNISIKHCTVHEYVFKELCFARYMHFHISSKLYRAILLLLIFPMAMSAKKKPFFEMCAQTERFY